MNRTERNQFFNQLNAEAVRLGEEQVIALQRQLCRTDLFYLLTRGCGREDIDRDWLYERCVEVQANPDGRLDLWAREHYKSTIITFGLTIQDILNDQELTVGIFSHTKSIARGFLRQIKYEFETNERLKYLFPDILYANPRKEAPNWSEENGITVKRTTNPKEATVEGWGLVDGQPTSKHFKLLIYDDVVTRESVTTTEQIKKTTEAWELSLNLGADGGRKRYIGTRYHFNDTYKVIMERGSAIKRLHPATDNGKADGKPVFLSQEALAEKRRDMGVYVFGCFVAGTKVLMADFTEKSVNEIRPGEKVVGYANGSGGKRTSLVPSEVIACSERLMPVVRITFESGREVVCTADHKFWSGRVERGYAPLSVGKKHGYLSGACSVYDPRVVREPASEFDAGYLAGIIDGEGGWSGNTVHIHQSPEHNPIVCELIETTLGRCRISYRAGKGKKSATDYYLTGGREQKIRLLNLIGNTGKSAKIAQGIFSNGTRNIGKGCRDRVVSIEAVGERTVYNIQTETGNYIAEGYAVKNCQMLQDPKADQVQGFKLEWLRYYDTEPDPATVNFYIVVDPANEKKKESDHTAMWVLGLGPDRNYYVYDIVYDRLNLTERTTKLFELHRDYLPLGVGYEHYGMQADVQHIESEMDRIGYRFNVTPLGGNTPKPDRIRRLVPKFEQGRIWLPRALWRTDYEGKRHNLVKRFIDEEYLPFPVGAHDDLLDGLARILDQDLAAQFPQIRKREKKESWQDKLRRKMAEDRYSGPGSHMTV